MKELVVARHGHAEPFESETTDSARALTRRGRADAVAIGARLARHPWQPDLIVASTALRAQETAQCLAQGLACAATLISVESRLYQADTAAWRDVIRSLSSSAHRALLVGHNPGVSQFAQWLAGSRFVPGFSPATLVRFTLAIDDWQDLAPGAIADERREDARTWQRPE